MNRESDRHLRSTLRLSCAVARLYRSKMSAARHKYAYHVGCNRQVVWSFALRGPVWLGPSCPHLAGLARSKSYQFQLQNPSPVPPAPLAPPACPSRRGCYLLLSRYLYLTFVWLPAHHPPPLDCNCSQTLLVRDGASGSLVHHLPAAPAML